jgi:hypothetical protein
VTPIVSAVDRSDSTFKIVAGLADSSLVSFESTSMPGYYLRHSAFRLTLQKLASPTDTAFKNDATFRLVPGLANVNAASFESRNYPGYFIRHSSYHLYVQSGSGDAFNKDATFREAFPKLY